jgi:hypothetical protein
MKSKAKTSLVVAGTVLLVILHLLNGLLGFAHLNDLKVLYPGGQVITEPGSGPSVLNIFYVVVHFIGAVLLIVGTVLLSKEKVVRARVAYIAAAICGLLPSPVLGLACLVFGAIVTGTWGSSRQHPQ